MRSNKFATCRKLAARVPSHLSVVIRCTVLYCDESNKHCATLRQRLAFENTKNDSMLLWFDILLLALQASQVLGLLPHLVQVTLTRADPAVGAAATAAFQARI